MGYYEQENKRLFSAIISLGFEITNLCVSEVNKMQIKNLHEVITFLGKYLLELPYSVNYDE